MKRLGLALAIVVVVSCSTTPNAASPSASPATEDFGAPPQGVPLIYVADPRHSGWYVGVDWSGKPRATIKLSRALGPLQTLVQAPDGSAFVLTTVKGSNGAFLDRLGKPIADPNVPSPRTMWSDDSMRVCTLDSDGGQPSQWVLGLETPGSPATVHPVVLDPMIVQSGIIAIDFASCSPKNDRAVLVYNYFRRPTDVYVARISDGAVLFHQSHPANLLAGITASEDGALIAENSSESSGYLAGPTAAHTTVRRVADGSIVGQLAPSLFVVAFSRDDSMVLVSTSPLASGAPTNLALVRLADGSVRWRQASNEEYGGRWVRPDGGDIAFQLGPSAGPASGPVELVIVHPNGTATTVDLR